MARDAKGASSVGQTGHKDVINKYQAGDAKQQAIADSLKSLKKLREKADYEPQTPCARADGTDAVSQSAKVLKLLGVKLPSLLSAPGTQVSTRV